MAEFRMAANQNRLQPIAGETADGSVTQLNTSSRAVGRLKKRDDDDKIPQNSTKDYGTKRSVNSGSSMAQMLAAAARGEEQHVGTSATDSADGLRRMTAAIHGVCATRNDAPTEK